MARGQNISPAVMQQRHEPLDSLDDFPTPPWATRAILREMDALGLIGHGDTVREPCANRGYMVRPLSERFGAVEASDVADYGLGYPVADYLFGVDPPLVDWTFINPPFRLAQAFIERAVHTSRKGVAVFVRNAFAEGKERYHQLFRPHPPAFEFQHSERVALVRGRYDPDAASATAYCWMLWLTGRQDTRKRWIAPCKAQLFRADDAEPFPAPGHG